MRRKKVCGECGTNAAMNTFDLRFEQCTRGHFNISKSEFALAMKMREEGFNFHDFADKIDALADKYGTAKEFFLKDVIDEEDKTSTGEK